MEEEGENSCFEQSYICHPLSQIGKPQYLKDGNRIIMPPSAFDRLVGMNNIQYPMLFKIRSNSGDPERRRRRHVSHCGVLEFTSEEGFVYLPLWMMKNLGAREGELVVLKNVSLANGTYMKIRPHKTKFIDLPDPKAILERGLKDFACVTVGDTIVINHENCRYSIDVLETEPSNAICVVDTDCSVEFAPPLDYKEPEKINKPKPITTTTSSIDHQQIPEPKFKPFTGAARRLDGEAVPMLVEESDKKQYSSGLKKRAAGKLIAFGGAQEKDVSNPNPSKKPRLASSTTSSAHDTKENKKPKVEDKKFQPFTGKKYTFFGA